MASPSQTYLSTRGGSYGLSFEEVVLKGLAPDGMRTTVFVELSIYHAAEI
jgi:hypothetical protein